MSRPRIDAIVGRGPTTLAFLMAFVFTQITIYNARDTVLKRLDQLEQRLPTASIAVEESSR